jgi:hypothetical protein
MKRLALILFICATTTVVSAQDYLGFQFGYAQPITRLNAPTAKTTLTPTSYNGFKVGFIYDATIVKGFGVTMGLNYTFGANSTDWKDIHEGYSTAQERFKTMYHQVELLVDWQYKFEIAKETWLILYTGPTLQYGLDFKKTGYTRAHISLPEMETDNVTNLYEVGDMSLKRLNVTWGVGAGFQYDRYFLRGGYDFGIINPYKERSFVGHDAYTRGRFDQWQIKVGMYLWQFR